MSRSGGISARAGVLAMVLHVGAVSLLAADTAPWDDRPLAAAPAAVAKAAEKLEPPEDADVEILLQDTTLRFDGQGRLERTTRQVFRCLTRQGVDDWATVDVDWAPWHQDRPTIRARVISPSGAAYTLDPASIAEAPAEQDATVLSDRRRLRAPLPAVEIGAVVEWEYVLRERQCRFDRGDVHYMMLGMFLPTRRVRLTVEAPAELPLHHAVRGIELKPKRAEADGRVKLVYDLRPEKPLTWPEPYLPPEVPRWPTVVLATGKSWGDVAAGYSEIVEKQVDLEVVRPIVRSELGGQKDRQAKIARLLAAVRRLVRYTGVAFGDAAIVPGKPGDTLARRYGDCKDQSLLLVCMLRAADIPAHVALIQPNDWRPPLPEMPGLGAFTHAIVYVPGDPPLWIDPTAECVPCDRVPLSEQGRVALVADAATTALSQVPIHRYQESSYTNHFEFDFSRAETVVRERFTSRGSCAWDMRAAYAEMSKSQWRKNWEDYIKETYLKGTLAKLDVGPMSDLDKPLTVEAHIQGAVVPELLVGDRKRVILLRPSELFDRLPFLLRFEPEEDEADEEGDDGRRKKPLVLREPHVATIEYRVVPPPGFAVEELPSDQKQQFGPATLSQHFELADDGTVHGTFCFDTGPGRFTPEEVDSLRAGVAALGKDGDLYQWEVELPLVHKALEHLAAGRIKEALAEHHRTLKRMPDSATERMRYAESLLKAGLGEPARREARRAVELEPESAELQADLGRVLVCDLVGRRFGRTMDWDGAAAAYRKVLELDPDDFRARLDYAILLEHSPLGRRYELTHLKEAAQQYRLALKTPLASPDPWRVNLGIILMSCGHSEEVARLPVDAKSSDGLKSLYLAAIAVREGADKAVRRSAELTQDQDQRQSVLQDAVVELDRAREYAAAVALIEAASKVDIETYESSLDYERRLRQWKEEDPPDADPQRLVRHVLAHLLAGRDFAEVLPWFVEGTSKEDLRDTLPLALNHYDYDAGHSEQVTPPWRKADVVTAWEFKIDGDEGIGYRLRSGDLESPGWSEFYVVPTKKGLRLVAPGRNCSGMARVAMLCLDAGKPERAKKLLGWAYQHHRSEVGWFDPWSGIPFARLWWLAPPRDDEQIRLAAATLACEGPGAEKAAALVAKVRAAPELDKSKALQLDRVLASAYVRQRQWADALEALDRIDEGHMKQTWGWRIETLLGLGKTDEALRLTRVLLQKKDDANWREQCGLAAMAGNCGDFELARKTSLDALPKSRLKANLYNQLAWNSLFLKKTDEKVVGYARKACESSDGGNSAFFHTLAAVCAEVGDNKEAIDSLRRSIDERRGEVATYDWFVLGRLAEQYEMKEVAAEYYARVVDDEPTHASTTYRLAQRRLKALLGKP